MTPIAVETQDYVAISAVILRFAYALDQQDWELCRTCFLEEIETDYSDLRGDPPAIVKADDFVAARRTALAGLKTLHQSTNHQVTLHDDQATCISYAVIFRWLPATQDHFHTYAIYTHHLQPTAAGWKIARVKQTVIWNEGNAQIHGALRK